MLSPLIQKLQETLDNPGFYKHLTPEEQAELLLILFAPKPKLFEKPTVVKGVDGVTPVADRDYLSKASAERIIADVTKKTRVELEKIVAERLSTVVDGKDAVITDELIERIAEIAQSMIALPDFPTLITMEPQAIRNSLELLQDGEKLAQSAIEGLERDIKELRERPSHVVTGGISRNAVQAMISASATGGQDWSFYATTWSVEPTLNSSITGGNVYNYTLDGTTRYRFVPTTYNATQDAFYTTFVNPTLSGLIIARG